METMSMMTGTKRRAVLLLALLAAACGGDGRFAGTVTDSAGVQIVTSPPQGMWAAGEVPTIAEELRIGTTGDDPNYQFGQIAGIDVGADGSIYVLDQQSRNVRVFDAQGKYVRTLGGPGSGPGELSALTVGLLVTGDSVLVPDMGQQRVTRYLSDGTVVGSFPTPITEGISVRWEHAAGGRIVQQTRFMSFPGQAAVEPKDLLLLRDFSGAILDTVLTLPAGKTLQSNAQGMSVKFFDAEPVWTMGQDGIVYYAMNNVYRIQGYTADGALKRVVIKDVERKPVGESDKTAFLNMMKKLFASQGVPQAAVDQALSIMSFAEYYPAFATLLGGPEGTLWVQRIQTADEVMGSADAADFNPQDLGAPTWDVFDADGRYLGEVRLPAKFTPLRFMGDQIWGSQRDELDVQNAVRLRVTSPAT
jgi:hypothetical protein